MASSVFLNIGSGGNQTFPGNVTAGGQFLAADGTTAAPSYAFTSSPSTGFYYQATGNVVVSSAGSVVGKFSANAAVGLSMATGVPIGFSSDPLLAAPDIRISRLAAGQLIVSQDSTHGVAIDVATDGTAKLLSRAGADTAVLSANQFQTTLALIATGGGGGNPALVVASTGGTNQPTTAAQNGWMKAKDSTGATIWIPVWK